MHRIILLIVTLSFCFTSIFSQHYKIGGRVLDSKNNPIEFATVLLSEKALWSVTNEKGEFVLNDIPKGNSILHINCLGYVKTSINLNIQQDTLDLVIYLKNSDLTLDEVVITAQRKEGDLTTSYVIDRAALDHAQILNATDVTSLLPGGKTPLKNHLAQEEDDRFSLRSKASENGNASFGTAIELDGVRLDNNSTMVAGLTKSDGSSKQTKGASTRGISTVNIESFEVITGIPSVEYGDLSNGIVKINTRKGKTPFYVEFATKPNTKQYAISKGFDLGKQAGILNISFEHTKSNSDIASPYTTYDRNAFSLTYSKAFNQTNKRPITLTTGVSGNIGGYNSKADPDEYKDTYKKYRDNAIRGNLKLNWLLNTSWITNLELFGSVNYADKLLKTNEYKNTASSQASIHGLEEGYFLSLPFDSNPSAPIIQGPVGYWYELKYTDNKPITYALKLKGNWVRKFGNISNKILVGTEYNRSGNKGKGVFYDDMEFAPTWREYKYKDLPYINNIALYAEDKITVPVRSQSIFQLTAGIRSDITSISNSEYGTVNSISPRLNAKYTFWKGSKKLVRDLSVHGGWGKAVKLPSFEVLYPKPSYTDKLSFSHNPGKEDKAIYGYYIYPNKAVYNPDLKWQQNKQVELGVEANILGAKITLSAFHNKTINPYLATNVYTPYSYNQTRSDALNSNLIDAANRIFSIDQTTGIVTVSDRSGAVSSQQLAYDIRNTYKSNTKYTNGSPIERRGIEWIIDLPQIPALRTSFRVDGNYYYYKGIEETMIASIPSTLLNMADGNPYKYIGYYSGSSSASNGSLSKEVNTNLTITTHIPKIRLIISMKIESSFYKYSRNLSEYEGNKRGFVWDGADYFGTDSDIYGGDKYVAVYPLYYSTWEEPNEKKSFTEDFVWARDNDQFMFNELKKLVALSNHKTTFNTDKLSAYFTANLSVTKEIGDFATISFYANNFINSLARVRSSKEDTEISLYNSNYIPKFYYGLTLRLKI